MDIYCQSSVTAFGNVNYKSIDIRDSWWKNVKLDGTALQIVLGTKDNNFGLDERAFNELVYQLKEGDTTLFKRVFLAHFEDCMKYVKRKYGATQDDAYDCTMDTMLNFRQRMVDDKITHGNLRFLFTQMASQHYLRNKKKINKLSADLPEHVEMEDDVPMPIDTDLKVLRIAWSKLKPPCQELLKLNFYQGYKLNEIASKQNKSASAIRKQKERCKAQLIELFQKESK